MPVGPYTMKEDKTPDKRTENGKTVNYSGNKDKEFVLTVSATGDITSEPKPAAQTAP